ncbi:MAG: cobalamin-dependent protein [Synergistaceae bacterium]|jgi:hypothetical protein|nr:cobalamin-dependent protein [Synergistaceae bacterium]
MAEHAAEELRKKIKRILTGELPSAKDIISEGRKIAAGLKIGRTEFFNMMDVSSEAEYKRRCIAERKIMYHCHIGMSTWQDTAGALQEIFRVSRKNDFIQDRAGLCLDRRMALPSELREKALAETGPMLETEDEWMNVGRAAPIQPHMGDFMIGFPASVENTVHALKAGVTTIGNLSQFFAHEAPMWRDQTATVAATAKAIAIMGCLREQGTLFHSYLDDGFGALFTDSATVAGWAMMEKYIVEDLFGAKIAHCMGGLITDPIKRSGWIFALDEIHEHDCVGSMFFGDTLSLTADFSANRGVLAEYMLWDIATQLECPTGHGLLNMPVTEAIRVPSVEEIIDAQIFARRLEKAARRIHPLLDFTPSKCFARKVVDEGKKVFENAMSGLREFGVDIGDPVLMLYLLKSLGPAVFEEAFGAGAPDDEYSRGRKPVVPNDVFESSEACAAMYGSLFSADGSHHVFDGKRLIVASTDVHEHALYVISKLLRIAGATIINIGPERNPEDIAETAAIEQPDAILVSTHNGMALAYAHRLLDEMKERNVETPIFFGGVLNQKVDGETLPVDVTSDITRLNIRTIPDLNALIASANELWDM